MNPQANTSRPIVVAGHACLDLIPRFKGPARLEPGTLVEVGPMTIATGGVSNVGVALHRLGTPARLIHKIGDDELGITLRRTFESLSPEMASDIRTVAGETTSYTVVVSPPGVDRMFVHCPGSNDTFASADVPESALTGASHLHFGYPPLMKVIREHPDQLKTIFDRARGMGLTTSLDFSSIDPESEAGRHDWRGWLKTVLASCDFFLPSLDEACTAMRIERPIGYAATREVLFRLADMGPRVVMLKLGERGLIVYDRETSTVLDRPCFEVNVVSTTGSGDCTIAGFLYALIAQHCDLSNAATFAAAVGAFACEVADATSGVPSARAVWARQSKPWQTLPGIIKP